MTVAQRLYEAGYITYMRTDSTNLSAEAVGACRDHIQSEYGDRYLPEQTRTYTAKDDAQEAHEAIRPSDVGTRPEQLNGVDADAVRLYDLIRNQFIACQMTDAEYLSTSIKASAGILNCAFVDVFCSSMDLPAYYRRCRAKKRRLCQTCSRARH